MPRSLAALAMSSEVVRPAARRAESMAGTRFFRGDRAGVVKVERAGAADLHEPFGVRDGADTAADRAEQDGGDGVRVRLAFLACDERRADLRGEKGSQPSMKPCRGVSGVWTWDGGGGVEKRQGDGGAMLTGKCRC
jgi:hypothetical protein